MIHPFNWPTVLSLLYISIIVITMVYIAVQHEDLPIPIMMVFSAMWPLFYLVLCLTSTLDWYATTKQNITTKLKNRTKPNTNSINIKDRSSKNDIKLGRIKYVERVKK